jgi:hypothetical protein
MMLSSRVSAVGTDWPPPCACLIDPYEVVVAHLGELRAREKPPTERVSVEIR